MSQGGVVIGIRYAPACQDEYVVAYCGQVLIISGTQIRTQNLSAHILFDERWFVYDHIICEGLAEIIHEQHDVVVAHGDLGPDFVAPEPPLIAVWAAPMGGLQCYDHKRAVVVHVVADEWMLSMSFTGLIWHNEAVFRSAEAGTTIFGTTSGELILNYASLCSEFNFHNGDWKCGDKRKRTGGHTPSRALVVDPKHPVGAVRKWLPFLQHMAHDIFELLAQDAGDEYVHQLAGVYAETAALEMGPFPKLMDWIGSLFGRKGSWWPTATIFNVFGDWHPEKIHDARYSSTAAVWWRMPGTHLCIHYVLKGQLTVRIAGYEPLMVANEGQLLIYPGEFYVTPQDNTFTSPLVTLTFTV